MGPVSLFGVCGCPPPQGAHVAIFERPLGPEGDLDRLFAVGGHGGARVANLGEVDDSEPYLGVRLAVSRAGHLGSHVGLEPPVCPICVQNPGEVAAPGAGGGGEQYAAGVRYRLFSLILVRRTFLI